MKDILPNIFKYIDVRKYLEDFRIAMKTADPGFTHAYICHKLGQPHSRSYYSNVVNGVKNISAGFIDLFINLLNLDSHEAKYFRALVNYNQTESAQEKEFYFDQIVALNRTPYKLLDKNTYAYYKEWHHSTIRSLLGIINFKNDYKLLASKVCPQITVRQARESINLLKRLGLIQPDAKGYLKPIDKVLSTGPSVEDHLIKQYQLKNIELGKCALVNAMDTSCKTITYTIYVSGKGYKRLIDRMDQFRSEIRSIIHKDEEPSTRVYQMNLQLFAKSK
jgi:uncharacterized protein (TIGR02147 family)